MSLIYLISVILLRVILHSFRFSDKIQSLKKSSPSFWILSIMPILNTWYLLYFLGWIFSNKKNRLRKENEFAKVCDGLDNLLKITLNSRQNG